MPTLTIVELSKNSIEIAKKRFKVFGLMHSFIKEMLKIYRFVTKKN
jgi:hypothetical protein